jgi:hypothetical protein
MRQVCLLACFYGMLGLVLHFLTGWMRQVCCLSDTHLPRCVMCLMPYQEAGLPGAVPSELGQEEVWRPLQDWTARIIG